MLLKSFGDKAARIPNKIFFRVDFITDGGKFVLIKP